MQIVVEEGNSMDYFVVGLTADYWKSHYENMPIQIYWKFYHQKMKLFR